MRILVVLLFVVLLFSAFADAEKANPKDPSTESKHSAPKGKRFVDNGDGTILDTNTGLVWLKDANVNKSRLPLHAAKLYVEDMNNGKHPNLGYANWRLPTINDLETLVNKSRFYPALPEGHPFVNIQNHYYWSATEGRDIADNVWVLDMASGNTMMEYLSYCNFKYLWPVRSSVIQKAKSGTVLAGGLNERGQLGDGTTEEEREELLPVQGLTDAIKISAGMEHAVALKSDSTVWGWGRNAEGQLGDGTNDDKSVPVMVKGLWNVVDVSAGMYHTVVLKSDGTVWGWGRNYYGQLGDGTIEDRRTPVQVKDISEVVHIFAGMYNTFALKSDGTVWAWGRNNYGQLGDGTTLDSRVPVQIEKLSNIADISSGIYHTVALKSDGTVWAWGWNMFGLLGEETKEDIRGPMQIRGLSGIVSVSVGMYHTAALKSDGTVWTWGKNEYGQLGISTAATAIAVTPTMVEGINGVQKVIAGMYHSVALRSDGTIWIWGQDLKSKREKSSPMQKKGLAGNFISISAGKYYTLALRGSSESSK